MTQESLTNQKADAARIRRKGSDDRPIANACSPHRTTGVCSLSMAVASSVSSAKLPTSRSSKSSPSGQEKGLWMCATGLLDYADKDWKWLRAMFAPRAWMYEQLRENVAQVSQLIHRSFLNGEGGLTGKHRKPAHGSLRS